MDMINDDAAVLAFAALGQPVRLAALRLLLTSGEAGLLAGEIARRLGVLPNTLSANLAALSAAGLVRSSREGRAIRYRADFDGLGAVLRFLLEDCCGGRPEVCRSLIGQIAVPA